MGWGAKNASGAPQPRPAALPPARQEGPGEVVTAKAPVDTPQRAGRKRAEHAPEPEPEPAAEAPSAAALAQREWHQLKSRKGWTEATLLMLMHEFVQSRGMFADLVKFTQKR